MKKIAILGSTGSIGSQTLDDLSAKVGKDFPGRITGYDVRFFGLCEKCMNK